MYLCPEGERFEGIILLIGCVVEPRNYHLFKLVANGLVDYTLFWPEFFFETFLVYRKKYSLKTRQAPDDISKVLTNG